MPSDFVVERLARYGQLGDRRSYVADIDPTVVKDARVICKKLRLTGRSNRRDLRPDAAAIDAAR